MIINNTTGQVMTNSSFPDSNWVGEGWSLVPAYLESRAMSFSPFCILEFAKNGDLIGIEPDEDGLSAAAERQNAEILIEKLKQQLASTDYKALKYAEGYISAEEYEGTRVQRQLWRDEINRLETELG